MDASSTQLQASLRGTTPRQYNVQHLNMALSIFELPQPHQPQWFPHTYYPYPNQNINPEALTTQDATTLLTSSIFHQDPQLEQQHVLKKAYFGTKHPNQEDIELMTPYSNLSIESQIDALLSDLNGIDATSTSLYLTPATFAVNYGLNEDDVNVGENLDSLFSSSTTMSDTTQSTEASISNAIEPLPHLSFLSDSATSPITTSSTIHLVHIAPAPSQPQSNPYQLSKTITSFYNQELWFHLHPHISPFLSATGITSSTSPSNPNTPPSATTTTSTERSALRACFNVPSTVFSTQEASCLVPNSIKPFPLVQTQPFSLFPSPISLQQASSANNTICDVFHSFTPCSIENEQKINRAIENAKISATMLYYGLRPQMLILQSMVDSTSEIIDQDSYWVPEYARSDAPGFTIMKEQEKKELTAINHVGPKMVHDLVRSISNILYEQRLYGYRANEVHVGRDFQNRQNSSPHSLHPSTITANLASSSPNSHPNPQPPVIATMNDDFSNIISFQNLFLAQSMHDSTTPQQIDDQTYTTQQRDDRNLRRRAKIHHKGTTPGLLAQKFVHPYPTDEQLVQYLLDTKRYTQYDITMTLGNLPTGTNLQPVALDDDSAQSDQNASNLRRTMPEAQNGQNPLNSTAPTTQTSSNFNTENTFQNQQIGQFDKGQAKTSSSYKPTFYRFGPSIIPSGCTVKVYDDNLVEWILLGSDDHPTELFFHNEINQDVFTLPDGTIPSNIQESVQNAHMTLIQLESTIAAEARSRVMKYFPKNKETRTGTSASAPSQHVSAIMANTNSNLSNIDATVKVGKVSGTVVNHQFTTLPQVVIELPYNDVDQHGTDYPFDEESGNDDNCDGDEGDVDHPAGKNAVSDTHPSRGSHSLEFQGKGENSHDDEDDDDNIMTIDDGEDDEAYVVKRRSASSISTNKAKQTRSARHKKLQASIASTPTPPPATTGRPRRQSIVNPSADELKHDTTGSTDATVIPKRTTRRSAAAASMLNDNSKTTRSNHHDSDKTKTASQTDDDDDDDDDEEDEVSTSRSKIRRSRSRRGRLARKK